MENINSDEYKKYKIKQEIDSTENHKEYIESEKTQWKNRDDYYEEYVISDIKICDVLSNDGVVKLLKKIYSLPKKKFKVKSYYKKPPLLKNKYDYIHLQYYHSHHGIFSEIELLEDQYIEGIKITWTQINGYFAFLEYHFSFKKCLNDELYNKFIYDNLQKINSKDFFHWYNVGESRDDFENYLSLYQMNEEYFAIICQHYITSFLYSEQGKLYQLVNMVGMTRKQPINIDKIYLGDMGYSYHDKKENYIITCDYEQVNYCLLAGNNRIPQFSLCRYVARYGNEFYYQFFGQ